MKTIPMYYFMPSHGLRDDLKSLFPYGTTTSDLINLDLRCATTRNKFASVGQSFAIQGCRGIFEVVRIIEVDFKTDEGIAQWELLEGWKHAYAVGQFPRQVYHGATQTVFTRIDAPAVVAYPIPDNDDLWDEYVIGVAA